MSKIYRRKIFTIGAISEVIKNMQSIIFDLIVSPNLHSISITKKNYIII